MVNLSKHTPADAFIYGGDNRPVISANTAKHAAAGRSYFERNRWRRLSGVPGRDVDKAAALLRIVVA